MNDPGPGRPEPRIVAFKDREPLPNAEGSPEDSPIVRQMLRFARLARENGFQVGIDESLDSLRFAGEADILDPGALRFGLRALYCSTSADWRRFDDLFDSFWIDRGRRVELRVAGTVARPGGEAEAPGLEKIGLDSEASGEAAEGTIGGASAAERLASIDFRHLRDADELAAVHDLTERLARRMRWRLTRRHRVRARGRAIDLRNTIHKNLHYGGTPMKLVYRRRHPKPLKLVVILDASGSMSLYSTFFIRFIRGIVENFAESEAFVFHTRLVHLSAALREKDIERAVERMSVMSAGWGGGTRIGESLRAFNKNHAKTALTSRSVVMIVSDGYDTGPPELLAAQVKKLRGRAKRLIWLNPLLGWEGYEPVARGMEAAMPHIDLFAPAHNLESLMALEPYLCRL